MGAAVEKILKGLWICLLVTVVCVAGNQNDNNWVPQCITNAECDGLTTCIDLKCQDPCPGVCSGNATCEVRDHVPYCACKPEYSGSPLTGCRQQADQNAKCSFIRPSGRKVYRVERLIKFNVYGAIVYCLTHGGRLATIMSKEENDQIKEEIRKTSIRNDHFWVSGTNYPVGHWVWLSSGEPLPEYSDWEPGEPNGAGEEHCLEFFEHHNNGYMWNDLSCANEQYPICEYFE